MDLIPIPPWSDTQVAEYTDLSIKTALSYGLTSIHDADMKMDHLKFFKGYLLSILLIKNEI
jgi:hypothetical protein